MGSVASYEARVTAVYKRKIKIEEPNSQEEVENFLKKRGVKFGKVLKKEISIENVDFNNSEHIGYVYEDDEGMSSAYKSEGNIEYYINEDCEVIYPIVKMTSDELRYLDLNVLKNLNYYDNSDNFDERIVIEAIGDSIYCSNDNSSLSKINIPLNILQDLLDKKCILYLEGDGSGDNC